MYLFRPAERVGLADEQDDVLVEEGLDPEVGVGEGQVHDRAVEASARKQHAQRRRGGLRRDQPHPWVREREAVQQREHEPTAGRRDHPEAHASDDLLAKRGQVGGYGVQFRLDSPCPRLHRPALLCEQARLAVDQLYPELALEALYVA